MTKAIRTFFAAAFLVVLVALALPLARTAKRSRTHGLAEKFPLKQIFIDLNGGACRVAGRRICNKRMRYVNGMLGRPYLPRQNEKDMTASPEYRAMADLARDLDRLGIPFLFALAPCKIDDNMELFPEGWVGGNPNADGRDLIACLEECGVSTLDFTRRFAATTEAVTESFYFTDHHWNIRSAFAAATSIVEKLSVMLGVQGGMELAGIRMEDWEWRTVPGGFIGSHGRRTGSMFSGIDDFEYAVPRFATQMERNQPAAGISLTGDFLRVEIVAKNLLPIAILKRYQVYCGPDFGYQIHRNSSPRRPQRIMVVKDSFGKPIVSFLAALFREVVEVDCRYLSNGETLLSLVVRHRPDVVVRVANPSTLHFEAGKEEERR